MQLIGAAYDERSLFALGAAYERGHGAYHMTKQAFGGNGHAV
jgi:Asp-tRNA(Asn)/Glu-tRNA(Gln) amidotransferase A subunit family amidase